MFPPFGPKRIRVSPGDRRQFRNVGTGKKEQKRQRHRRGTVSYDVFCVRYNRDSK